MGEASLFSRVVLSVPTSKYKVGRFGQGVPVAVGYCLSSRANKQGRRRKGRRQRRRRRRRKKGREEGGREGGREGRRRAERGQGRKVSIH